MVELEVYSQDGSLYLRQTDSRDKAGYPKEEVWHGDFRHEANKVYFNMQTKSGYTVEGLRYVLAREHPPQLDGASGAQLNIARRRVLEAWQEQALRLARRPVAFGLTFGTLALVLAAFGVAALMLAGRRRVAAASSMASTRSLLQDADPYGLIEGDAVE